MEERILNKIAQKVNDTGIELTKNTPLDGLIDSITFVKLVVDLETEFDFEFEDEMLSSSKFETVEKLIEYVKQQTGEQ